MTICSYSFKENYFSLKLFSIFSFKVDSIALAKILERDPDPNSIYLDPQHGFKLNKIIDCCDALIWGQPEDQKRET